jgi:hypothetical protein
MTTEQYEEKYLNKIVHYYPVGKKDVYGKINSINRETAFGTPTIIFRLGHSLYEIEEQYFEQQIAIL